MKNWLLYFIIILLLTLPLISAATLKGVIYNSNLDPEINVLLEVNTTPVQKYLSKNGEYSFNLLKGEYQLTVTKGLLKITEEVTIQDNGIFIYDLFLLPSLDDEEELWQDANQQYFNENDVTETETPWWSWVIGGLIAIYAIVRFYRARKKFGPLGAFRKRVKADARKSIEEHKAELAKEPGYLEKTIEIINKHDGRISQKDLRKELAYLSEAKVSLIITELEHKGKVEKIKKGRSNVVILKN